MLIKVNCYTIPTIQLLKDSCIVDKGLKMGVFQREKINKNTTLRIQILKKILKKLFQYAII